MIWLYYRVLVLIILFFFFKSLSFTSLLLPYRNFWTGWKHWLLKANISLTAVKIVMIMSRWSVLTCKMPKRISYRSSKPRDVCCYRPSSSIRNCRVWEHTQTPHTNIDLPSTLISLYIYTVLIDRQIYTVHGSWIFGVWWLFYC